MVTTRAGPGTWGSSQRCQGRTSVDSGLWPAKPLRQSRVWPPARRYCTSEGPCFDVCKVGCVWEFHLSFETRAIGRWMRDSKLQRLGTAGSSSVVVVVVIGQTEGCLLACLLAPLPSCVSWSFSLTICHLLFSSYIHYNQCLCGGAPGWLSLEVSFRLQARAASRRIKWRPWRCWEGQAGELHEIVAWCVTPCPIQPASTRDRTKDGLLEDGLALVA